MPKIFDDEGQIMSSPYVVNSDEVRQQSMIPKKQRTIDGGSLLSSQDHFINAGAGNFLNPVTTQSLFFKLF